VRQDAADKARNKSDVSDMSAIGVGRYMVPEAAAQNDAAQIKVNAAIPLYFCAMG
jgi:hypothetical protein